jgi:Asp-tRNA(Asn)/Glu-tRNA(Gln) amidotransferase A subunit family amidase
MAVEASRSLRTEAATGGLSESLQTLLDQGRATSVEAYDAAVAQASTERHILLERLDGFDAVLAPAAPGAAPVGMATGSPTFSRPWQVLRLPSLTLSGARDRAGMPLGLQVIGRPGGEGHLLAVARWLGCWLGD